MVSERNYTDGQDTPTTGLNRPMKGLAKWKIVPNLPVQHIADIPRLALANDELLTVVQGDEPPLTCDHAHLPDLLNIY